MGKVITVDFRNDTLFAVERDDGVFIALKPIVDRMGLSWGSQHNRLMRDPILSEGIFTTKMPSIGGAQETTCLKMQLLNGWLFGIDESRVKDHEVREVILTYKRECYSVLFDRFYGKMTKEAPLIEDEPHENESVKLRMINESRQVFGTQAAAQLWFRLGLPVVPAMLHDPRQLNLLDYSVIKTAEAA
ncbi:Phage P22, antirepressor protein [Hyphomicrobiales bacterium]|nr:Phage P22, antirepressor protein [Hyphomicrobiales bacterium]CAH1668370.1 Phage P22, antirepressor protein [Hyphomicrobiales bacterium]